MARGDWSRQSRRKALPRCARADGEIEVFDVWESQEALEAFGPEGFIPILTELGVELRPPTIWPVRNTIQG